MVCTFFGHKDTPPNIAEPLRATLVDLIENKQVTTFYFGNQGAFDGVVKTTVKDLKKTYPFISYAVVLAYLPQKNGPHEDGTQTLFPEGLETIHPKFALDRRNTWLVEHADYVVTYVTRSFGGAAKFKTLAEKKGKSVINIAETV